MLSLGGVSIAGDAFDSRLKWDKIAKYFGRNARHKSITGWILDMPNAITFKLINWHVILQAPNEQRQENSPGQKNHCR